MIKEIWKDIEGYEGLYLISNFGRVKSLPKTWWNGFYYVKTSEKVLRQTKDTKGYLKVNLCKNKKHITHRVHRLIANAFIENPLNKPYINHINGNKEDNSISNLEWVTHQENVKHAQDTGLNLARFSVAQKEAIKKTAKNRRKLSVEQVIKIKILRRYFGFGGHRISKICNLPKHLVDSVIYNKSFKEIA